MKIAYISTYTPRQCGIATFTADLLSGVDYNDNQQVLEQHVFAVSDEPGAYDYPAEVVFEVQQQNLAHYLGAADIINSGGYAVAVVEHEYGIYGGNSGVYILSLIKKLKIPVLVNLHTVLERPSADEKVIMIELGQKAEKLIVTSTHAVGLLQEIYGVPLSKIAVIPHGVPQYNQGQQEAKELLGLNDKRVLLSFGFLSRNKGLHVALRALPAVVKQFPDTVYLIVGKTHPNVRKEMGEEYRDSLKVLVEELGLQNHVVFDDSFVDEKMLTRYLSACDIYLTPYLNEAQITSGTLSFAVGAGACVVSTPYWHAKELLADGRGVFVDFDSSEGITNKLLWLFNNPDRLFAVRAAVSDYRHILSWKKVAREYMALYMQARQGFVLTDTGGQTVTKKQSIPSLDLRHIKRLTNQVGIIQHATYATPNYHHGYCLDDNARALLLALMVQEDHSDADVDDLISTYISYTYYAQREDGQFKNFMSFDNRFLEDIGSDDAFGRCIWGLGYLVRSKGNASYRQVGKELFVRSMKHFRTFRSLRAVAYIVLGLVHYLEHEPHNKELITELRYLATFMQDEYNGNRSADWSWFEKIVSYDNAILPLALFRANSVLHDPDLHLIAMRSAAFLDKVLFRTGHLSLIGNSGWYGTGGRVAQFGQQPIEVYSTMLLYEAMYQHDGNEHHLDRARAAYDWFFGGNDLQLKLYDPESGGCCDGLEAYGVNRNQGAESTLTFWLSTIHINRLEKYYPLAQSASRRSAKFTVA